MKEEIIDEGLDEENGLNKLTTGVLVALGNQMAQEIKKQKGHFDLGTYGFVHTGGIDKKYQEQLGEEVYSFWNKLDLLVSIVRSKKTGSAQYIHSPKADGTYNFGATKRIELKTSPEDMQNLADEVTKYGDDFTGSDVYFKLYYLFHSPLLHELRHAFDDMRTNGMIFQDKKAIKFRSKYDHMNAAPADDIDPDIFKQRRGKAYLQQPHEIWARASQAMHNLRYTKGVAELGDTVEMLPLKDVVGKFKSNFRYWREISEKARRRLIKAVANSWHNAQEQLRGQLAEKVEIGIGGQELEDEIEMRLRPDESFLDATNILQIAAEMGVDEMDVIEAVQGFVLKREHEKYKEANDDIKEYVAWLQDQGVRTDNESIDAMTKSFLEVNGNYHTREMGMDFTVLRNIMRMATKDPEQLKMFEAIRRAIQRQLQESA